MSVPKLVSKRLVLRKVLLSDAPSVYKLRSDPKVMRFINRPPLKSLAEAKKMIRTLHKDLANGKVLAWTITKTAAPKSLIGQVVLWNIDHANSRAEIGYTMLPEFHGKGYMSEATNLVVDYAFKQAGFQSVEAWVNPANVASVKVLERLGFKYCGQLRCNQKLADGSFGSTDIYDLLRDDWL